MYSNNLKVVMIPGISKMRQLNLYKDLCLMEDCLRDVIYDIKKAKSKQLELEYHKRSNTLLNKLKGNK